MSLKGFVIAVFLAVLIIGALCLLLTYVANPPASPSLLEDFNGALSVRPKPEPLDYNFSCPDCLCSASCSSKSKVFEGCHIPARYLRERPKTMDYTGFSNIPSIFAGNTLKVIDVTNPLFPGCFYAFDYGGETIIHRLLGAYENHVVFRGDNNDEFENVRYSDVKFLVTGIEFT